MSLVHSKQEGGVRPMRTSWRIGLFSTGMLLVGAVALLAYLNSSSGHVSDQTDHQPNQVPSCGGRNSLSEIDDLGAPERIRTEADAKAYMDAVWFKSDTKSDLAIALARAEYAAVHDQQKLIPESRIVKTFNAQMDEEQMPGWTHVSVEELHYLRLAWACAGYYQSVGRLPDGSLAPACRPVEAIRLYQQLVALGGVQVYVRDAVRQHHFPWNTLKELHLWHPAVWTPPPGLLQEMATPGHHVWAPPPGVRLQPTPEDVRMAKYSACLSRYMDNHPEATGPAAKAQTKKFYTELGIPLDTEVK